MPKPITASHNGLRSLLASQILLTLVTVLRGVFAASTLLAVTLLACSDNSNESPSPTSVPGTNNPPTVAVRVTPKTKPTAIPAAATPVVETSMRGEIIRQANETPQSTGLRELQSAVCTSDLLIIKTSLETVYAVLTCDKFDNDQFAQFFAGKQVALVLEVAPDRYRILINALDGASAEITPDSIWVE